MVMRRNMMRRNLRRTIVKSLGRYLAIMAIIALGCAIFVGLRITKTDMVATGQKYTDEQNMFDLRLLSSYGWDKADVETIGQMEGIVDAEGSVTLDAYVRRGDAKEDVVFKIHSLPQRISKPYLLGGRMPEAENECLLDGAGVGDEVLGTVITVTDANEEDTLDMLTCHTYTVVGYTSSPLYMDLTRGNTTLGNGSVSSYLYIPEAAFDTDYYTEIQLTIPGDYRVYSEEFLDAMDTMAEKLEPQIQIVADDRLVNLRHDAEEQNADGLKEYEDGRKEFEKAKAEVLTELADALKKLQEGQAELDRNLQTLLDGEKELLEKEVLLQEGFDKLTQGKADLEKAKADTYAQLAAAQQELIDNEAAAKAGLAQIEEGLPQIVEGLAQIDDGLTQIEEGLPQLELAITLGQTEVSAAQAALGFANLTGNAELIASAQSRLDEANAALRD